MNICFINPPFKSEYGKFSRESRSPSIGHSGVLYYPLWLIYAAAVAKKNGFDVTFIDAPAKRMNKDETLKKVSEYTNDPKLFVLDTSTPSIYSDVDFGATLKYLYPNSKIMLVGTHPSATDIETLGINDKIDIIARREYDYIVLEVAKSLRDGKNLKDVKGITYRDNKNIIQKNEDMDLIESLDDIPFASKFIKEYLDEYDYVFPAASFPAIQIFTGRGCPARCNYCVYPQTLHGHKYRLRSAKNVVEEFQFIADNFPNVKEIVIEDDTFTILKDRVIEICQLLIDKKLNKRLKWLCNARVNLDYETMKMMKKAGCRLIIPGVESYNQEILKNICKGTTLKQIDDYMANAKKARLLVHACYMVGNEGETHETMKNTLKAALRFKTDSAQFFPLIPYPGTIAYNWAKEKGYISGKYEDYLQEDGTLNCVISTQELSSKELVDFCAYARKKYYMRPWYFLHRIKVGLAHPSDLKRSIKAFGRLKKSLFNKSK